jgi:pimeloyl-[acyl-carrier protein] methyl ester esterase
LNPFLVKTSGNIKGESLVMIHGWGMNSGVWESIRSALESEYAMVWIDLPGYGVNSEVIANSMDDIVDLIAPHITDSAHILGWSLGGLVAQALVESIYINTSKKLKSLTLVASSPKFSQSNDWDYGLSHDILDNFSKNLQDDVESTLKRFVALQFMGIKGAKELQRALIGKLLASLNCKTSKNRGGGSIKTLKKPHYQALTLGLEILKYADYRKPSHKVPQHWILAGRDRLISPTVINDLKSLRPNDQITLLENAGHAPFMTDPKDFLVCMKPFINNAPSA